MADDEAREAQAKGWLRRIEELRSSRRGKRPPRSPREFADRRVQVSLMARLGEAANSA
jgi:hypothetical protein